METVSCYHHVDCDAMMRFHGYQTVGYDDVGGVVGVDCYTSVSIYIYHITSHSEYTLNN